MTGRTIFPSLSSLSRLKKGGFHCEIVFPTTSATATLVIRRTMRIRCQSFGACMDACMLWRWKAFSRHTFFLDKEHNHDYATLLHADRFCMHAPQLPTCILPGLTHTCRPQDFCFEHFFNNMSTFFAWQ